MAFTRVEKLRMGGHMAPEPIVTMGAHLADGKKANSKGVAFRISRPLVTQLGWIPDDNGRLRIAINEGSGSDKGFLQLVPDPQGRYATMKSDSNQGVSLNSDIQSFKHYVLNECPVSAHAVPHVIDGDALIIECPDWLRHNPQSVPEPVKKSAPVTQLHRRGRRA